MTFAHRLALATALVIAFPFALGCRPSTTPLPVVEPTLAEQAEAVRRGATDMIHLERRAVADSDLAALAELENLRVLLLDNTSLTDRGAALLADCTQLQHLRVRGGTIGDDGLQVLAQLPDLRILNLPHTRCTAAGLAQLRSSPRLTQLRLGSPMLTDESVAVLTEFPSLRQVHLIDVPLTDAALETFAQLEGLESLYLDGAQLTDAGVEALLRRRPNLHLHLNQQHHDRDPRKGTHAHP